MNPVISIIIPNYNGSRTIGKCLDSVFAAHGPDTEVVVVDDCSDDGSADIISRYPCRLIRLPQRSGASAARNAAARSSTGEFLFFIDADCVLREDTLSIVRKHLSSQSADLVIGGTYTPEPYDPGFFNLFQSVFVNYFETKNPASPDYLATHALVIRADMFRRTGGFRETFLPILEDVEFSHRLRQAGYRMAIKPDIQVRHIFGFSLARSLRNAARKTRYWTVYSLVNRDMFTDSGTASREIKITGGIWLLSAVLALTSVFAREPGFLAALLPFSAAAWFAVNRRLLEAFHKAGGLRFSLPAGIYYCMVYPAAVWWGAVRGAVQYSKENIFLTRSREATKE